MTRGKKTILNVGLFLGVFAALLTVATFTDLQISQILTKGALEPGNYYATDYFGVLFECIGSSPVYLLLAFCAQVLFWASQRFLNNSALKAVSGIAAIAGSVAAYWYYFSETMKYIIRHIGAEDLSDYQKTIYKTVCVFFAVMMTAAALPGVKRIRDESLKKLIWFVFAFVCAAAVASLLVDVIKGPVGRMRYRTMNTDGGQLVGGFDNFTPWYVVNGQKYTSAEMITLFGTADACRSFPSGHTNAAAMSYGLILFNDCFDIKSKKLRALMWIIPIVFTGAVAVSRIVVGAHFFSDVLVGGTLAFAFMMIFREVFVLKFANVKALFGRA